MSKPLIHLLCNAHIDPVWQWEWEEGAAAAVSTFRAAAEFCEENDRFVFCHNEALLYRWVEEYEPKLFTRIQALVDQGKWHIIGGWYLQPDCNMPSGESLIRQMRLGREYFESRFGVRPSVAVSFDAFGHSRGLTQLLKKAGYEGYLFMRPDTHDLELPAGDFIWVGFDGSRIPAHRLDMGYNSALGCAREKVEAWLDQHSDAELGLITWGVGNHGGGPSRKDIADLNRLIDERQDVAMSHSTPEAYFADLKASCRVLPEFERSLNPWAVGCYTSQIRIKQKHRQLEAMLTKTEKIMTHAHLLGLLEYPHEQLEEAERDLCMSEFHDILPGSSVQPVEETSLRQLDHGLEILTRLHARAFFALASQSTRAVPGEIPVLIYNPHAHPVEGDFSCEFMLADQNWKDEFTRPRVYAHGAELPSQVEKEDSNLSLDWRKRMVFHATLAPMSINRFDCRMDVLPQKPEPCCETEDGCYVVRTPEYEARVGIASGLLEKYAVSGKDYLCGASIVPLALRDNEDPWGMTVNRFGEVIGEFTPVDPEESARFSGVRATLPPVRVVESGDVRTVIESVLGWGRSRVVIQYVLPARGAQIEVRLRALFAEKDTMLKLAIRTPLVEGYLGQVAFGADSLPTDGREAVSQRWCAAVGGDRALTVINDGVYGSSFEQGELRLSLLRGAAYAAHPIYDRPLVPPDRFTPRMDQGERLYAFRIEGGERQERLARVDREAADFAETPYALSFFPNGTGANACCEQSALSLSDGAVRLTALRQTRDGRLLIRLFEPSGVARSTVLSVPALGIERSIGLSPFEIKTFSLDLQTRELQEESDLLM